MEAQWLILVAFIVIAIVAAVASHFAAQKRRKGLEEFARRMGLHFQPDVSDDFPYLFEALGLTPFGQGRSRRAYNLLHGQRGAVEWLLFDYQYTTGSGKNKRTVRYGVVAARVPFDFPRTVIRPEGIFDKVAAMAGFDDINFESEAFSRRYHVSGGNRKFAYDLVHPQMMEYLLSLPAMHWQLAPGVVMIIQGGRYDADHLPGLMAAVEGLLARVPEFVRREVAQGLRR